MAQLHTLFEAENANSNATSDAKSVVGNILLLEVDYSVTGATPKIELQGSVTDDFTTLADAAGSNLEVELDPAASNIKLAVSVIPRGMQYRLAYTSNGATGSFSAKVLEG